MIEDKNIPGNSDDLSVLRVLMHNIKGISANAETPTFAFVDDEVEE